MTIDRDAISVTCILGFQDDSSSLVIELKCFLQATNNDVVSNLPGTEVRYFHLLIFFSLVTRVTSFLLPFLAHACNSPYLILSIRRGMVGVRVLYVVVPIKVQSSSKKCD